MFLFDQNTSVYKSSLIQTPHGFGTKMTGDGRDLDVIKTVLKNEDIDYSTIVIPSQKHSTDVTAITDEVQDSILKPENTDGVVTNRKGIVLTVVTADCVPIIYYDPVAQVIGISHGGWKGTLEKISGNVIDKMIKRGSKKEHIVVAIGPSIGSCCYNIYGERLDAFRSQFDESILKRRNNEKFVDLQKANMATLLDLGIQDNQIETLDLCTSCQRKDFFSYKREGGIIGEMFTFAVLRR